MIRNECYNIDNKKVLPITTVRPIIYLVNITVQFPGWGGYFFVFLSERITTSVITSINTSVYVRRSEKVITPITSFLKRLKANRLP